MKYRIVERKTCGGTSYYVVQKKFLFRYHYYPMYTIHMNGCRALLEKCIVNFISKEDAEAGLRNSIRKTRSYKGVTLIPTWQNKTYFSKYHQYYNIQYDREELIIFGSYRKCCSIIDEYLNGKQNLKYEKIYQLDL